MAAQPDHPASGADRGCCLPRPLRPRRAVGTSTRPTSPRASTAEAPARPAQDQRADGCSASCSWGRWRPSSWRFTRRSRSMILRRPGRRPARGGRGRPPCASASRQQPDRAAQPPARAHPVRRRPGLSRSRRQPQAPADLGRHNCLRQLPPPAGRLRFRARRRAGARARARQPAGQQRRCPLRQRRARRGRHRLPARFLLGEDLGTGALVHLLPDWEAPEVRCCRSSIEGMD